MKQEAVTFRRSQIILPSSEEPHIPEKNSTESSQNPFFKKLLSTIAHQIKFGKNFYTHIVQRFATIFTEKYGVDRTSRPVSSEFEPRKLSAKEPFSFLKSGSFLLSFTKKASVNPLNTTKVTSAPMDCQVSVKTAAEEIKEFRKILILLLTELVKNLPNFSDVQWTATNSRLLLETVNDILFGNEQLYNSMMKLIGSALGEKQEDFMKQKIYTKNMTTEEYQIHPNFCMEGEPHPYLSAVEVMNMLGQHFTPEDKFKTVCATKMEVIKAVDRYWDIKDPNKPNSELIISADELLPIYTYIVSKTSGGKLLCEMYFIEEFLDQHTLYFSENSYFFATVSAATSFILTLSKAKGMKICE